MSVPWDQPRGRFWELLPLRRCLSLMITNPGGSWPRPAGLSRSFSPVGSERQTCTCHVTPLKARHVALPPKPPARARSGPWAQLVRDRGLGRKRKRKRSLCSIPSSEVAVDAVAAEPRTHHPTTCDGSPRGGSCSHRSRCRWGARCLTLSSRPLPTWTCGGQRPGRWASSPPPHCPTAGGCCATGVGSGTVGRSARHPRPSFPVPPCHATAVHVLGS